MSHRSMRHALAGSTLFLFVGIATLEAQPPTPTRTPTVVRPSPTVSRGGASQGDTFETGGTQGQPTSGRPGDGNSPVRSDSTGAPPPATGSASQVLSDVAAQYDALESAIEAAYQKTVADQKTEIEELQAQMAAVNEQIRQLREMQAKLKKSAAAMKSIMEQQAAANLSKKIGTLEARAQKLKAGMIIRTPVPKTPTPKR